MSSPVPEKTWPSTIVGITTRSAPDELLSVTWVETLLYIVVIPLPNDSLNVPLLTIVTPDPQNWSCGGALSA